MVFAVESNDSDLMPLSIFHMGSDSALAQLAGAVEYTDCFSAVGLDPNNGTKQFDGDVPVTPELRGIRSTPSLSSLPGPLLPGLEVPHEVLYMGQKELKCELMLNWIAWKRTDLKKTWKLALNNLRRLICPKPKLPTNHQTHHGALHQEPGWERASLKRECDDWKTLYLERGLTSSWKQPRQWEYIFDPYHP